jgi:hypothetical protein
VGQYFLQDLTFLGRGYIIKNMILKIRESARKKNHITCFLKKEKEVFQEDGQCKVFIRARLKENAQKEEVYTNSLPLSILGGRQLK